MSDAVAGEIHIESAPSAMLPAPVVEQAHGGGQVERPLLAVEDLRVVFRGRSTGLRGKTPSIVAVDGVAFEVRRGETLGVVGESGSGKSTIGRALVGLVQPERGRITFDGLELPYKRSGTPLALRRRMQMIFQDPYSSLDPRMTVGASVAEPLNAHTRRTGRAVDERVAELFGQVGLDPGSRRRYPHEFSGGQRQRIGIARALASEPDLVIADEPVSALDVSVQAQIVNLLRDLQATLGLTMIFIAHDLSLVQYVSDRIAVMYLGRIVELASREAMRTRPMHPYTVALLSAVPIPDPDRERGRRRIILRDDAMAADATDQGCPFRPRCWLWESLGKPERCATVAPALVEHEADHTTACHFAEETAGSAHAGR